MVGFYIFRSREYTAQCHKTCPFPSHTYLPPTCAKGSTCSNQVLYFCTPAQHITLNYFQCLISSAQRSSSLAFGVIRGLAKAVLCTPWKGRLSTKPQSRQRRFTQGMWCPKGVLIVTPIASPCCGANRQHRDYI